MRGRGARPASRGPASIRPMHIVLEAAKLDITAPVVVGLVFFLILVVGLGFVRQVGAFRPHSKSLDE